MMKMRMTKLTAILLTLVMMLGLVPSVSVSAAYENTHVNTGNQAHDIVEVAKTQIGYTEGSNNDTKYNRWFGSLSGFGYNYAWCQTFVAWCANQAGISTDDIARVSGTISAKDAYKNNGTYHYGPYEGGSYTPKKGDIIFFYSSATDSKHHVGIVSDCINGTVYTIEGNTSDKVLEGSYPVTHGNIRGYGVPEYSGETVVPDITPPVDGTYFPACDSSYTSIVEALNSIGVDSSYAYRKTIAAANGISNYSGTADQNTTMLNLLKAGTLINPEGSSAELVTPTITTDKLSYTVGDTVYLSWAASPANSNLSHYWLKIDAPDGTTILNETMSLNTSYNFTVSQAGNYTITSFATPQGSSDGSGSLTDTAVISVENKQLSFSASTQNVNINYSKNETGIVTFSYANAPGTIHLNFAHGDNRVTNCTWGDWTEDNTVQLTIEGYASGTEYLTVNLVDSDTEAVLSSIVITVNVTSDPLEFYSSTTSVTLGKEPFAAESYDVNFWYYNYSDGVTISYEHGENRLTDCTWGEWSNDEVSLTITPQEVDNSGTETITVHLKNTSSGEILSTIYVDVTVLDCVCTVEWNSNYNGGSSQYTDFDWGDTFDNYADYARFERDGYLFDGWSTDPDGESIITYTTEIPEVENLTLYAQWTPINYDIQLSFESIEITLDELEESDYIVEVPVYISGSGGWKMLEFGASWETNKLTCKSIMDGTVIQNAIMNDISILSFPTRNDSSGICWIGCSVYDYRSIYLDDGHIYTIRFKVNSSAKAGDVYVIKALLENNGSQASIATADGSTNFDVNSAAIIIKENITTTTTTTAKTTTTTTKTTTTTTKTTTTTTKTTTTTAKTTTTTAKTTTTTTKTTTTTAKTTTTSTTDNKKNVFYGDINLDGIVSLIDVICLNKYNAGSISLNSQQVDNSNVAYDNAINASDARVLLMYIVEQVNILPLSLE